MSKSNRELEEDNPFRKFGDFQPLEAKQILKRLEEESVRFEIDAGFNSHADCGAGGSAWITIFTHVDDEKKVRKILNERCKI